MEGSYGEGPSDFEERCRKFRKLSDQAIQKLSHEEYEEYMDNLKDFVNSDEESIASDYENDPNFMPKEGEEELLREERFDDDAESDVEQVASAETEDPEDVDDSENEEQLADQLAADMASQPRLSQEANTFISRDGKHWNKEAPPANRRRLSHNIRRNTRQQGLQQGPTIKMKGLSMSATFKELITIEICDIVIRETNRRAVQNCQAWNEKNPNNKQRIWTPLTAVEFDGYLGIILFAGVSRSNYEHSKDLWTMFAHPLYRATMSINRFWDISKYIRFDNGNTRQERLLTDKAAPITEIWQMLNDNLRSCYNAGDNVTIDEQLYPYRGGTRFTQYIPSKPAKYGIKVWWACDATTSYPLTGQIYTGLGPDGIREKNQGERVVTDLCKIFKGSGRTITCDNFFTSYNLAQTLKDDYGLSMIGTVNKRRTFIPPEFLVVKGQPREMFSSQFGFLDNITLCSYFPKRNKAVVLLSTAHYSTAVVGQERKPEIIIAYNRTKGGVDNMDKMLGEYSCKRRTQRWPLAFFYNILDVAGLAAYILYRANNPSNISDTSSRRKFLQQLCRQLVLPQVQLRSENNHITRNFSTRNAIEAILETKLIIRATRGESSSSELQRDSTGRIPQKGNCYICKKRRPSRKACTTCNRPVCSEHSNDHTTCENC